MTGAISECHPVTPEIRVNNEIYAILCYPLHPIWNVWATWLCIFLLTEAQERTEVKEQAQFRWICRVSVSRSGRSQEAAKRRGGWQGCEGFSLGILGYRCSLDKMDTTVAPKHLRPLTLFFACFACAFHVLFMCFHVFSARTTHWSRPPIYTNNKRSLFFVLITLLVLWLMLLPVLLLHH